MVVERYYGERLQTGHRTCGGWADDGMHDASSLSSCEYVTDRVRGGGRCTSTTWVAVLCVSFLCCRGIAEWTRVLCARKRRLVKDDCIMSTQAKAYSTIR